MFNDEELRHLSLAEVMEEYIRLRLSITYSVIKYKCDKQDLAFDFKIDDLAPFPLVCPVLEIPIDYFKKGHGGSNYSPSIDRVIPDNGYVRGNVRIISQKANRLKQNSSIDEQIQLLAYSSNTDPIEIEEVIKKESL